MVHRDVKPSNLVFCVEERRFKFIDLGACVDLRSGTNYIPEESILDVIYCPPEQYVLPTDAPQLSKNAFSMVISPMLWNKHKPDRFDVYSAGLIFFQLAVPVMCSDRAIKSFVQSFEQNDYDLMKWKQNSTLLSRHTQILDANDGAGWDLLAQMLRPRRVVQSDDGTVSFVDNKDGALRISAEAALNHPFFKAAEMEPKPLTNLWRKYSRKLFDLEGKILSRVFETEEQTTTVKKLRKDFAVGKASAEELQKEETKLDSLQTSLKAMQGEFVSLSKAAFQRFGIAKQPTVPEAETESKKHVTSLKKHRSCLGGTQKPSKSLFGWLNRAPAKNESGGLSGAENLVYAGLKFTGLAARVANDLAQSIKKDAEKLMTDIETENAQKVRRDGSSLYRSNVLF